MTLLLALVILVSIPVFTVLLGQNKRYRLWAFAGITLIPFLPDLPTIGYLYGWAYWHGTALGFSVTLGDSLAIALLMTRRDWRKKQLFWPLFIFYGFCLFTSIFASANWIGTTFVWWQFAKVLLFFVVVSGEAHRPEVRNYLLAGIALGLLYQAGMVIPQKLAGVVQANGSMASKNLLGLMVEISIVPLVGAVLAGSRNKLIYSGIFAGLLCATATGSRAGMVFTAAAIAGLLLFSLLRKSTPRKVKAVALSAMALVIASPFAISTLNDRFQGQSFAVGDETREAFENAARSMAADYPLGVGANQFVWVSIREEYAERAGVSWRAADRSKPVHNAYLLARAETGWHGQISLFLMLVVPIFAALRMGFANRNHPQGDLALACAFALSAIGIHSNWEFDLHSPEIQYLLFMNFAIISSFYRDAQQKRSPSRDKAMPANPREIPERKLVY